MNAGFALLLALGMGIVAGLRSLSAPAVVAWAAHLGWTNLHGSPSAFMGTTWAVGIFTVLALVELIVDLLPRYAALARLRWASSARIVTGALSGACLAVAGGATPWLGAPAGAVGAIAGAFGGYNARAGLVRALRVPDFVIAIAEDLVAIGLGVFLVSRF